MADITSLNLVLGLIIQLDYTFMTYMPIQNKKNRQLFYTDTMQLFNKKT